jgi:hypothetical protein
MNISDEGCSNVVNNVLKVKLGITYYLGSSVMWHLYLVLTMRSFEVKKRKYHTEKIASLSNNNKIVETEPKRIPSHTHIYIYIYIHECSLFWLGTYTSKEMSRFH